MECVFTFSYWELRIKDLIADKGSERHDDDHHEELVLKT